MRFRPSFLSLNSICSRPRRASVDLFDAAKALVVRGIGPALKACAVLTVPLLFTAPPVEAAAPLARPKSRCESVFKTLTLEESQKAFWKRDRVHIRNLQQSSTLHVTYSYDSEFLVGDAVSYLRSRVSPAEMQKIDERINALAQPFSKSEVLRELNVSEAQLATFALRKGVDPADSFFEFSDFNSRTLSIFFEKLDYNSHQRLQHILKTPMEQSLESDGLKAEFEMDGKSPEVKHRSSAASPKEFLEQVAKLHRLIKKPQTHFHVALPKDATTYASSKMIARAVEARIIVGLLRRADPSQDKTLPWDQSQFVKEREDIGGRGLVKLEFNLFKTPFAAHDFEIREWSSFEDGLRSVEITTKLLEHGPNDARLAKLSRPTLKGIDERYGAVGAALEAVANVLSVNATTRALAGDLHALAIRANSATRFNRTENPVIEEIARVLRQREVARLYDEALLSAP